MVGAPLLLSALFFVVQSTQRIKLDWHHTTHLGKEHVHQACELGCTLCGYNWYTTHFNNGQGDEWWNRYCYCCGGTQAQQDTCKDVCVQASVQGILHYVTSCFPCDSTNVCANFALDQPNLESKEATSRARCRHGRLGLEYTTRLLERSISSSPRLRCREYFIK